jgi:hypothetical protein
MYFSISWITKTNNLMRNLLYIIAVVLIIGWLIGYFAYSAGALIHALLVIAMISVLFNVIRGGRPI